MTFKYRKRKGSLKYGYRKRKWIPKMVTGKELVSQVGLPEKNWYLKYGYRKRFGISNMITRKELVSQILLPE